MDLLLRRWNAASLGLGPARDAPLVVGLGASGLGAPRGSARLGARVPPPLMTMGTVGALVTEYSIARVGINLAH